MHIETWILTGTFTLGSIVFGYGLFRGQVTALTEKLNNHLDESSRQHQELKSQMSSQFKRIDAISEDNIRIKSETAHHIDMEIVEAKFVSKLELDLRLKNIDLELNYLTENAKEQTGKLDEVIAVLHKLTKTEDIN